MDAEWKWVIGLIIVATVVMGIGVFLCGEAHKYEDILYQRGYDQGVKDSTNTIPDDLIVFMPDGMTMRVDIKTKVVDPNSGEIRELSNYERQLLRNKWEQEIWNFPAQEKSCDVE